MTWVDRYKHAAIDRDRYEEMIKFLSDAEDVTTLHGRTIVFILNLKYERSDICLALKAIERDKGWSL